MTLRSAGVESNAVGIRVVDNLTKCTEPPETVAICGAAIGELPVIEMLPGHTWNPYAAVPAGGIVEVRNRDFSGENDRHTVTSAALQNRIPVLGDSQGDGRFHVNAFHPDAISEPTISYLRVLDEEESGDVPFFCAVHSSGMYPPTGLISVR